MALFTADIEFINALQDKFVVITGKSHLEIPVDLYLLKLNKRSMMHPQLTPGSLLKLRS